MKFTNKHITDAADKLLHKASQYDRLKQIGNKYNYTSKVTALLERLREEEAFWRRKDNPGNKLNDIVKDLKIIEEIQQVGIYTQQEKQLIDNLVNKYPIT